MNKQRGFTLIELLVVIAVIGLISSIISLAVNSSRDKARASPTASQLRELQKATAFYLDDTGQFPSACRLSCTSSSDPFLNSLGVLGWDGPYFTLWNFKHPWGGHIGFQALDWDGDGDIDYGFIVDDDAPGTSSSNNEGTIPLESLVRMDEILDDGNLATGSVRGNGQGFGAAVGELVIEYDL